jgi:LmbE family N-acetylglucosaminyl deacetylase
MKVLVLMLAAAAILSAQDQKIRVIAFGAHPDDCDIRASGTAALFAKMGYPVRFVSVTNGDAGHQTMKGPALAARRRIGAASRHRVRRSQ